MPGHAPVKAAGRCACRLAPPAKALGLVHASAEVQVLTANRRLRQVERRPFLPPCTSDTTKASRCSGRLSSLGEANAAMSPCWWG